MNWIILMLASTHIILKYQKLESIQQYHMVKHWPLDLVSINCRLQWPIGC